jgi:hypothetical protein
MQASLFGLKDCSNAHSLGRALQRQGHDVRLIATLFVSSRVNVALGVFVACEDSDSRLIKIFVALYPLNLSPSS